MELIDITAMVGDKVQTAGLKQGVCTLFNPPYHCRPDHQRGSGSGCQAGYHHRSAENCPDGPPLQTSGRKFTGAYHGLPDGEFSCRFY